MSDITNEWRELRPKIGNFICRMDGLNAQIDAKLKTLQEKEEQQADLQAKIDETYYKGIQDLYDALKIFYEMPNSDIIDKFGSTSLNKIIQYISPQDLMFKLNQWKAEKVKKEQELHVGDEVTTNDGTIGIVTSFGEDIVWITYRSTSKARGFNYCWVTKDKCKSTGRHFDSIPFDYNP